MLFSPPGVMISVPDIAVLSLAGALRWIQGQPTLHSAYRLFIKLNAYKGSLLIGNNQPAIHFNSFLL